MLLKHFRTTPSEISGILSGLGYDYSVLQYPTSRIDANILGRYLEFVVAKTANARIGLETGFLLPFVITGIFFNIFYRSKTVREIFENDEAFDPALNLLLELFISPSAALPRPGQRLMHPFSTLQLRMPVQRSKDTVLQKIPFPAPSENIR